MSKSKQKPPRQKSPKQKSPSKSLLALTAAALALPGISGVGQAATAPAESILSYRTTSYLEDDLLAANVSNLPTGTTERYDIDVQQFRFFTPIGNALSLDAMVQTEVLSGASPWSTNDTQVVMSGASINEERADVKLGLKYYSDESVFGIDLGNSSENDYDSNSLGVSWALDFNERHSTLSVGLGVSDDAVSATPGAAQVNSLDPAIGIEEKTSTSVYIGLGQVIGKNQLIQTGVSFAQQEGYLTNPYKLFDARPDSRDQTTWTLRYRLYSEDSDAALHLDYRYYSDSWEIKSHTLSMAWHKNLSNRWKLVPFVRYYTQNEASFYTSNDGSPAIGLYTSSDATLSSFGALSGGLKVEKWLGNSTFHFTIESYSTSVDLPAIAAVRRTPAS